MPPPASQGFGYPESMRGVWHHHDRRRRVPRELTGIVEHSWEGSSHGPLEWTWCRAGLAPCTRTGAERGEDFRAGVQIATLDPPSRDSKNAIAWPAPRTQPACAVPFTSSHSPVMPQVRDAAASSKTRPVTTGAQAIPSTTSGFSCAPGVLSQRSVNKNDFTQHSRQMRHTSSGEVAYHCAQHVRDVFHQVTPAHGRCLSARLVKR